jgi:hypothetical protein
VEVKQNTDMIPDDIREEMLKDKFYKKCCVSGRKDERIEWHHNLIYASKQIQEKFCILPLLKSVHRDIVKHKEKCDWIMLNRASEQQLTKYSKVINYRHKLKILNEKFGTYRE